MKKTLYGTVGICIALGILLLIRSFRNKPAEYVFGQITRGAITATCTATGAVNPLTTVLVGTQVSGRIKALYADYNSPVAQGELIAEIDPAAFEAQVEEARANLLSAKAQRARAEATLKDTERNLKRQRELYVSQVIGESELDAIATKYEVDKSQVAVARSQVVQAEAAFNLAETNLRYTKIYSPIDGVVISKNVDVGQTVAAAFQTPTLYTIAQDLRKMQLNTNVDEADIGKIKVGQLAEFTVDAYPETTFKGTVVQVRNAPLVVQSVVTYDVVIRVDNPEQLLKPGMTANVSIQVAKKESVLRIPNAALRYRPKDHQNAESNDGRRCVWVLKNHKPSAVPVETGIDDYSFTELLSDTLHQGQDVIIGQSPTTDE